MRAHASFHITAICLSIPLMVWGVFRLTSKILPAKRAALEKHEEEFIDEGRYKA